MSSFSAWSFTSRLTFWRVTRDDFSQPVYERMFTVPGSWSAGGRAQTADDGVQFVPQYTYHFEQPDTPPAMGWKVAVGEHVGPPPASAQIIKRAASWDTSQFNSGTPDMGAWT